MNRTSKPTANRPFFARFLEHQKLRGVGGGGNETHKFPSDGDEETTLIETTQKFPSDGDEEGGV